MESLILPGKRWGVDFTQVDYDDYTDFDKPKDKLEKLQVNCKYKTIIVDSVTSMGDTMTRQVRKQKRMSNDKGKMVGNISVSGLEEYNAESSAFQELTAILKDIHKFHNVNIILIAHVVGQRKNDEANNLTHHSRVIITGGDKIAGKLASYMTEAYHFNIESSFDVDSGEGKYGIYTSHTGNDYARTSLPLERKIMFNNEPLYDRWIKPAIIRLEGEKPIERIVDKPSTPQPPQQPPTTGFAIK